MTEKTQEPPFILITNDDGIDSPGLAAATAALQPLGDLLIVAPRTQQTGMGRSITQSGAYDGHLFRREVHFGDRSWPAVAINATPAMAVQHAFYTLAERAISLVVSGINFGENIGSCVTSSGTVGAALEAADRGIPALAVSLELNHTAYHDYDPAVDFTAAIHFTRYFAAKLLAYSLPPDVDFLKLEIPAAATTESVWMVTRQDKMSYYEPLPYQRRDHFSGPNVLGVRPRKGEYSAEDTDAFALSRDLVAVTPLSLDLTSRTDLADLAALLNQTE